MFAEIYVGMHQTYMRHKYMTIRMKAMRQSKWNRWLLFPFFFVHKYRSMNGHSLFLVPFSKAWASSQEVVRPVQRLSNKTCHIAFFIYGSRPRTLDNESTEQLSENQWPSEFFVEKLGKVGFNPTSARVGLNPTPQNSAEPNTTSTTTTRWLPTACWLNPECRLQAN